MCIGVCSLFVLFFFFFYLLYIYKALFLSSSIYLHSRIATGRYTLGYTDRFMAMPPGA